MTFAEAEYTAKSPSIFVDKSAGAEYSPEASTLTPIFHFGARIFIAVAPEVSICAFKAHAKRGAHIVA